MDRSSFAAGLRDAAPAVPPNLPFGIVFGTTAVVVGLSPLEATAMSLFTVAGAAQLAAVGLLQDGAAVPVILLTGLLINLRYVVFSVSLTPYVSHLSRRWRAVIAYPLFDVTYALAAARYQDGADGPADNGDDGESSDLATRADDALEGGDPADGETHREADVAVASPGPSGGDLHRGWYYLGVAIPMAGSFVVSTLAGALVGQTVGTGLHLDFFIPLIFLALLVPTIDSRETVIAAVTASVLAVGAAGLPFNLGLLVGLLSGTAAGTLAERTAVARGSQ